MIKNVNLKYQWLFSIFAIFTCINCSSEKQLEHTNSYQSTLEAHRTSLNYYFKNPETSPLNKKQLHSFEALNFFEIDEHYKVSTQVKTILSDEIVVLQTSTNNERKMIKKAVLNFELNGQQFTLYGYQEPNHSSNQLFVPFTDKTSGLTTYGGGRYLDVECSKADSTILDFNFAYLPYCAFNDAYSCPIPPEENHLDLEINAGQKL